MRALDDLVQQGKVRADRLLEFFGASRSTTRMTRRRAKHGAAAFVTCQDEYSLLVRDIERDLVPVDAAARHDASALLPARQRLAHRQIQRGNAAARRARGWPTAVTTPPMSSTSATGRWSRQLSALARRTGHSMLELAFGWLLAQPVTGERDRRRDHTGADRAECRRAAEPSPSPDVLAEIDRDHAIDASTMAARSSSAVRSAGCSPPTCCAASAGTPPCSSATPRSCPAAAPASARIRNCTTSPNGSASRSTIRWAFRSTRWSSSTTTATATTSGRPSG